MYLKRTHSTHYTHTFIGYQITPLIIIGSFYFILYFYLDEKEIIFILDDHIVNYYLTL